MPIINVIQSLTQQKYEINAYYENNEHKNKINHDFKIIADHLRACVFMIADGAIPSSKDRGSIIRRLFRRSMICLKRLGILDNFVTPIISSVVNTMKGFYPYLVVQQEKIIKILSNECNSFKNTLTIGYDLFNDAIRTNTLDTNTIFKLVDTYGFPFELIQDLASEKQITIDFEAYKSKLVEHQEISRKKTSETAMDMQKKDLMDFTHPSTFLYDTLTLNDAKVIGMFDEKFNKVNHLTQKG
jgi:alanyl-tRNA synthetase